MQHLILTNYYDYSDFEPTVDLDKVFGWFSMNPRLKDLQIWKLDDFVDPGKHNWNPILLKFKDTLQSLSMGGYTRAIVEDDMDSRFGPSRRLTCLPKLEKLTYLKVPLHYVSSHRPWPLKPMESSSGESSSDDDDDDHQTYSTAITAENIRQHIQSELPPSLKRLDIIEYELDPLGICGDYDEFIIRERKTYTIFL